MLSFKQFISEKTEYAAGADTTGRYFEVPYLRDPNLFELLSYMKRTKAGIARFFMDDSHTYIWDSYSLNHDEFFKMTGINSAGNNAPKWAIYTHEVEKASAENPGMSVRELLRNYQRPRNI